MTVTMDLTVPQYADLRATVSMLGGPESLAGYTGHMQVRATQDAATTLADYVSEIVIDAVERTVSIVVLAAATAGYAWTSGVYDLVITGGDGTYRVAEGRIMVSKGVTH